MKVSVVIPTFNRPEALYKCLQALNGQKVRFTWEIIIVNDGGSVNLETLINQFLDSLLVRSFYQENKGPAAARNLGVNHAKGEYIAFLDDDCEPASNWLSALLVDASTGCMIGGRTENKLKENAYSEFSQLLVSYLYKYFEKTPWYFFTSNNFIVDKETFLELDGFDETFETSAGEDREFCVRWSHLGNDIRYCSEALIYHSHKLNFYSFWRLHFKYGKAALNFKKKVEKIGVINLKPKMTFYFGLLSSIWKMTGKDPLSTIRLYILIVISQLATFFGFLKKKLKTFNHQG